MRETDLYDLQKNCYIKIFPTTMKLDFEKNPFDNKDVTP